MKKILWLVLFGFAGTLTSYATSIGLSDTTVTLQDRNGNPWTGCNVEIGGFVGGFVPTAANRSQWASNWFTTGTGYYVRTAGVPEWSAELVQSGNQTLAAGQQLYVWAFDSKTIGGTEWALYQDATWVMPVASPLGLAQTFALTPGTVAVLGTVNSGASTASTVLTNPVTFTVQPYSQISPVGGNVVLSVTTTATPPVTYQWSFNGVPISGATNSTLTLDNVQAGDAGAYTVTVGSPSDTVVSESATLTVGSGVTGRLVNLSIRTGAGSGSATLIVGFVAEGGSESAELLVRAAGPALTPYGVPDVLADPNLAIHDSTALIQTNDDWNSSLLATFAQVGAFPWTVGSKDAALALSLAPAPYTAMITGAAGATGVALAEIYDVNTGFDPSLPTLVNVSARSQVGTGDNIMIAGFVIAGDSAQQVLIRAVGPTLTNYGVTGVLADPQLAVFSGETQIDGNNDWDASLATTFAQIGASPLDAASKDAALLITLNPGVYTVQVGGFGGTTGVALVEIYAAP